MLIFNGVGRIGRDAETRTTGSGKSVTSFSAACDGYNGEKITTWVEVTIWGKRGESLARHLVKGSRVAFNGTGTLEIYDKRDGTKGAKLKCNASEVTPFFDGESSGRSSQGPPADASGKGEKFSDDEIPF